MDKAKEGAAYLITKTQDALGYTKDRLVGTGAAGSPTSATTTQVFMGSYRQRTAVRQHAAYHTI